MITLNISLPESVRTFVETQAKAGGFGSSDEYVQALIREAKKVHERAALEASLVAGIEALDRGEGIEMTAADWERLRHTIREQHTKAKDQ